MPGDARDLLLRIDALCERFERCWREGPPPRIEDHLAGIDPGEVPDLLRELLLAEWRQRRQRGETPSPDSYRSRFAAHAALVDDAWRQWLRWLAAPTGETPSELIPATQSGLSDIPSLPPLTPAPGYERLQWLGEGGMGVVYRAHDPRLNRTVALKMIRDGTLGSEGMARFRIEAEALARLSHPHIVQVFTWHEHEGRPCLVMEYIPAGSLEERLGSTPLPPAEAARLVAVLARAVQAAHAAGVVHRDLKPANVLMAAPVEGNSGTVFGGFPKVSDFGLARLAGLAGQTVKGQPIGTPAYMAPEQADGRVDQIGPAADVWALGVILYRCVAGALPFGGSVLEVLERVRSQAPAALNPRIPEELRTVCLECLEKSPSRRPTAAELAARLERFAAAAAHATRTTDWEHPLPPTVPTAEASTHRDERPSTRTKSRRGCTIAISVSVACLLIGVVVAGMRWEELKGLFGAKPEIPDGPEVAGRVAARIVSLRVRHAEVIDEKFGEIGVIGEKVFATRYKDGVQVEAELAAPAYAYLIAFNADGKEQLLWPVDARNEPDRTRPPEVAARFRYPPNKGDWLYLNDDETGGLQAFAVVASGRPLPSFDEWQTKRGKAAWRKLPPGERVWVADANGVYPWGPGGPLNRGKVGRLPGTPPLGELVQSLRRGADIDSVEVLAFGVLPKEGK